MIRLSTSLYSAINLHGWALSLCLLFGASAFAQNAEMESLAQARAAISKQEWTKAESLLLPLRQSQRQNPFVLYEMAQVYENTNRIDAAKKIYQDITTNPELVQSQPTVVIRAPYASRMVSLLSLAQTKLNAIEAKQLVSLPPPPTPIAKSPPDIVTPKLPVAVAPPPTPIAPPPPSSPPTSLAPPPSTVIEATLQKWADAWAQKDLPSYFASYTSNYRGTFSTPQKWRQQRQNRINQEKAIVLDFKNVEMTMLSPSRVKVQFLQTYTSSTKKDTTNKALIFASTNGRWLIEHESAE
jgi:hypothetical protein